VGGVDEAADALIVPLEEAVRETVGVLVTRGVGETVAGGMAKPVAWAV
jgi:hypothetical protein